MLFPPTLRQGDQGPAVEALQLLLCALGLGQDIERNGVFCETTEQAVRFLQVSLGLRGNAINGVFDSITRSAMKEKLRLDVDAIPK